MKRNRLRQGFVAAALVAGLVGSATSVAAADTVEKAPGFTKSLAAACDKAGGGSYGDHGSYGCTLNHPDGSGDTIECRSGKCTHYHYDPARVVTVPGRGLPGGIVTVRR